MRQDSQTLGGIKPSEVGRSAQILCLDFSYGNSNFFFQSDRDYCFAYKEAVGSQYNFLQITVIFQLEDGNS